MASVELTYETTLSVDHTDVAAIMTEHFCGGYGAFKNLRVEYVSTTDEGRTFVLTLVPKPKEASDA